MKRKNRSYTILFIPDDNKRAVSLHVNRSIIRSMVLFLVLLGFVVLVLIYFSAGIGLKLQLVAALEAENQLLREQNHTLMEVGTRIAVIEELDRYFTHLAHEAGVTPPPFVATASPSPPSGVYGTDTRDEEIAAIRHERSGVGDAPRTSQQSEAFFDALPYIRPVDGWITRTFGATDSTGVPFHEGIDIAATHGTPVQATAPGVVSEVFFDPFFGNMVVLRHPFDFVTRYGHCSQVLVGPGAHVRRGQTIALVGNTGRSTAPHLHYEVLKGGRPVDPMRYIIEHR